MRKELIVLTDPKEYWMRIQLQGGDTAYKDDRYMIGTNDFGWHATLNEELDWDIFGTKAELEVRLFTFAQKHELKIRALEHGRNHILTPITSLEELEWMNK